MAIFVWARAEAGLWEMTTTPTWQQSLPPGVTPPGGANAPFSGGTRTAKLLTQEQIDKYGAVVPEHRGCR